MVFSVFLENAANYGKVIPVYVAFGQRDLLNFTSNIRGLKKKKTTVMFFSKKGKKRNTFFFFLRRKAIGKI